MLRKALVSIAACMTAAALSCAPAWAELRDLRVGVDGPRAEITVVFDAAPTATSAAPGGGGVVVFASGVAAEPRFIETAGASLVRAVEVRQSEGGVELDLSLTSEATAARAWVEGNALRIAVLLAEPGGARVAPALIASGAGAGVPSQLPSDTAFPPLTASLGAPAPESAPPPALAVADASAPPTAAPGATADAVAAPGAPPVQEAAAAAPTPVDSVMTAPAPANAVVAPPLRLGGETTPSAATPDPADAISPVVPMLEPSDGATPQPPRDVARPSVIFAGGVTEEDCDAADTAVRADPWDLDALRRYAGCRAVDGDLPGSESAFRRLLTIVPDDTEAELGLAAVLHEKGDVAGAAAIYDRQLLNANGDAQAARLRALMALAVSGN